MFQIQHDTISIHVYEFPVIDEVARQLAGAAVEGKLPGGGSFKLDLWPRDEANLNAGAKLQLTITTTETEQRGSQLVETAPDDRSPAHDHNPSYER